MERAMNPLRRRHNRRQASVLLLVLFLMAITAPLTCLLLEAQATHIRCTHNHIGSMTALYVAEAGLADATAEILRRPTWRTGFTDKQLVADLGHTYTVTVANDGGDIVISSTGRTAGGFTKTVVVRLEGF
jgi:Tfp pilus assembly protein PilX